MKTNSNGKLKQPLKKLIVFYNWRQLKATASSTCKNNFPGFFFPLSPLESGSNAVLVRISETSVEGSNKKLKQAKNRFMTSVIHTQPKLCTYNNDLSKCWFVYFEVTDPVTKRTIRKQFRGGINYFNTVKKREKFGLDLVDYWKTKLKNGWTPFHSKKSQFDLSKLKFNDALDFALSKCSVAKKTRLCYQCSANFFKDAASNLFLSGMLMPLIKRVHIRMMLEYIKEKRKWSNGAYNKNMGYLSSILSQLIEWDVIEYNPASKIKKLPTVETQKFVPYTNEEKEIIREYLFLNHYRFYVYFLIIYHTGIRPKEVLALKIKDVDLATKRISIFPDIDEENSKTRKIRKVPINKQLLPYLRELNLNDHNKEYYLFGSPYEKGLGNRGSAKGKLFGVMHPDYFKPSLTRIKRDTVTKLWKKVVIDKLGINKHLYAAKHTGANAKILAGIPLDALQELYGHHSKLMTERYATVVKEVYREQIIENSPAF